MSREFIHIKISQRRLYPIAILQSMSNTNGCKKFTQITLSDSEDTEEELAEEANMLGSNCAVCLCPRISTWIFMPCGHTKFCANCSLQIMDMGQTVPICRSAQHN